MFVVLYSIMTLINITANINFISFLNDSNVKSRQENFLVVLAVIDLNLTFRVDSPPPLIDESTSDDKREIEYGKNHIACV